MQRPVNEEVLAALDTERAKLATKANLTETLDITGTWTADAADPAFTALLGYGWSDVENWGAWTDGEEAHLRIPAPHGRKWRATLVGDVYGPSGKVRVGVGPGNTPVDYVLADPTGPLALVVESAGNHQEVRLHLPEAHSPVNDGLSDSRFLGFGLRELTIELS